MLRQNAYLAPFAHAAHGSLLQRILLDQEITSWRASSVSQQQSSEGIIKVMTEATQAPANTESDFHARMAFLNFSSDFLVQFTRKAEILKLSQMAYFLSMAAMEATETLRTMQAQLETTGLVALAATAA
jgi:hypothetical protein